MKIGVTGHQVLESERSWAWVRAQIATVFRRYANEGLSVYSCLAAGADQEFAEMAVEAGIPVHVVIPCRDYERAFKSLEALNRYKVLLDSASDVELQDFREPTEDAFFSAGKKVVDAVNMMIAVWDGKPAAGKGGTEDIVKYAETQKRPIVHLDPERRTVNCI